MPLNLAQTAVSALKIGENALTAIYSGIIRVYPNEVTVSIDGANASSQSGTPGQPMNPFIYVVTPSNVSNYGWTDAQIAAATLTGLPAGFTATFSASGGLGAQTGTWTITTTDGNFPNTDTSITVASLTSTIAETTWGSIAVSWSSGSSQYASVTQTSSNFVGLSVSQSVDSRSQASSGIQAAAPVGTLYQATGGSVTTVSGQAPTRTSTTSLNQWYVTAGATWTIAGTGTATCSLNAGYSSPSTFVARVPIMQINGPPWNVNPSSNIQCYLNVNYGTGSGTQAIDNRVRWWGYTDFTGGSYSSPYYFTQNSSPDQTQPTNRFYSYYPGTGSGSYTINIANNIGISAAAYIADSTTRNASPAVSISWNWT